MSNEAAFNPSRAAQWAQHCRTAGVFSGDPHNAAGSPGMNNDESREPSRVRGSRGVVTAGAALVIVGLAIVATQLDNDNSLEQPRCRGQSPAARRQSHPTGRCPCSPTQHRNRTPHYGLGRPTTPRQRLHADNVMDVENGGYLWTDPLDGAVGAIDIGGVSGNWARPTGVLPSPRRRPRDRNCTRRDKTLEYGVVVDGNGDRIGRLLDRDRHRHTETPGVPRSG